MFFFLFFLINYCEASEESLHHVNMLLEKHAYKTVFLTGDPGKLNVECRFLMTPKKQSTVNASETKHILHQGVWHTAPFLLHEPPEGESHHLESRFSIEVDGKNTKKINCLRKITGEEFYYTAQEDKEFNTLHLTVTKNPVTRFLMIEPFIPPSPDENFSPSYVSHFKEKFNIPHEHVKYSYEIHFNRSQTIIFDYPFIIPLITHRIWITDPSSPKHPSDTCFTSYNETISVCHYGWQHIFWVHSLSDNPALVSSPTKCNENNKKVKVCELKLLFCDERVSALKPIYEQALTQKNYGKASDVARIAILYLMGGVYCDTDFSFVQDPKKIHQLCSFYAGFEDPQHTHLNNALIASVALHPILKNMMNIIDNPDSLPDRINNPIHSTLFHTGPFAFTRAVFSCSLEKVWLFPHSVFYSTEPIRKGIMNGTRIGVHKHLQEWTKN